MNIFEWLISPKFIFIILPIGIFSYWSIKGFFSGYQLKGNSNISQSNPTISSKKELEKVDAWYNPR